MRLLRYCLLALTLLGASAVAGQAAQPRSDSAAKVTGLSAVLKGPVDRDEMSLASKCGVARNGGSFCSESVGSEPGYVTVEPGERLTVRLGEGASRVRGDIVRRKDGETTKQYAGATKAKLV